MSANAPQAPHSTDRPPQTRHPYVSVAIPALSTAFGYVTGYGLGQQRAMGGFGLLWGIVAMLAAPRLARRGARSAGQANAPVYVMLPLACIVLGGAIIGHLTGPTPTAFLRLVRQPGYGRFFYAVHGPFEWVLMPWALIVNWTHRTRRRLLIVAAAIFYLGRLASALYFAPRAIHWGRHPAEAAAQRDQVARWIRLDPIRVIWQDTATAALVLLAALHPKFRLASSTTADA
jgi:hypothetical protein